MTREEVVLLGLLLLWVKLRFSSLFFVVLLGRDQAAPPQQKTGEKAAPPEEVESAAPTPKEGKEGSTTKQ